MKHHLTTRQQDDRDPGRLLLYNYTLMYVCFGLGGGRDTLFTAVFLLGMIMPRKNLWLGMITRIVFVCPGLTYSAAHYHHLDGLF